MVTLSSDLAPVQDSRQPRPAAAPLAGDAIWSPPSNMSMKEGLCPVGGQASVNVGVYAFPANGSSVNKPVFWISGDEYYYLAGVQCSPSRSLTFAAVVNGSGTNVANVTSIFVQVTRQGSPGPWQVPIPSNSCSVNQAFAILITDTNGIHHDPMIVVTPG